jgi:hypothetical protein
MYKWMAGGHYFGYAPPNYKEQTTNIIKTWVKK